MGLGIDLARTESPEHAAVLDELKDFGEVVKMNFLEKIREAICIHQFYPFYFHTGLYYSHYCLHCGKWKFLSNQASFYVNMSVMRRLVITRSLVEYSKAFRKLASAIKRANLRTTNSVLRFGKVMSD